MSRLGDQIKQERLQKGLTLKMVAKKCGVSEKYLLEVESGTKIIADVQAAQILKFLGVQEDPTADLGLPLEMDKPATPARAIPKAPPPKPPVDATPADAWMDALGSVIKRVPILDELGKEVGKRLLPVIGGKIEDANAEKVTYFRCADDSMAGFFMRKGDLLLVLPTPHPIDGAFMLVQIQGKRSVCRVRKLDMGRVLLTTHDREPKDTMMQTAEVTFLGRCARLEVELP